MSKFEAMKDSVSAQLSPIINPIKTKALDRWDELSNRDQIIASVLALCFVIVFFIVIIYAPLLKARDEARERYDSKLQLYSWMSSVAPQVKGAGDTGTASVVRNLMNTINTRAARFQLKLGRTQPEGGNKLRVSIKEAPFDALIRWLSELESLGIVVHSMSVDAEPQPGIVTAKVLLQGT